MNPELPRILATNYGTDSQSFMPRTSWVETTKTDYPRSYTPPLKDIDPLISTLLKLNQEKLPVTTKANELSRRYVQVFIVDPDEEVPLEKAMLYTGTPKMTDMTNEELFFSLPVMDILKKHNEFRKAHQVEIGTKKKFLKEIRIKDLSMTVVTIAQF